MLIKLNYALFSLLLVAYCLWRYLKQRGRHLLYFTLGFTFLASSTTLQVLNAIARSYGIYLSVALLRPLELGGLALFGGFTICAIIALRKSISSPQ
jgi:hypothetical protein